MTMRLRVAALAAVFGLTATIAFAVTQGSVGPRAAGPSQTLGTALVDFYGAMPAGIPIGP